MAGRGVAGGRRGRVAGGSWRAHGRRWRAHVRWGRRAQAVTMRRGGSTPMRGGRDRRALRAGASRGPSGCRCELRLTRGGGLRSVGAVGRRGWGRAGLPRARVRMRRRPHFEWLWHRQRRLGHGLGHGLSAQTLLVELRALLRRSAAERLLAVVVIAPTHAILAAAKGRLPPPIPKGGRACGALGTLGRSSCSR